MSIFTLASLWICLAQTQSVEQTKVFSNSEYGLAFEHPSSWQISTKKGDSKIVVPLEGGLTATIEIYSVVFNADTEIWRNVQKNIVLQMKRQLVEQQEEEILGVPLLTTRSRYTEKGIPTVSLSGLIYSATPRKMLFRLTAPESVFPEAESKWRGVLQSLRTVSGKPLSTEDPSRKVDLKEFKTVPERPVKVTRIEGVRKQEGEIRKGEISVPLRVANRDVVLHIPQGWQGEVTAEGEVTVRHPDLSEPLKVSIFFALDSEPPARSLFKASSRSLDLFSAVTKREEVAPTRNKAGATVQAVWRWGKSTSGDLATCEATGLLGDFYWLLTYRCTGMGSINEKKLIDSLIATMSVELAA